MKNTPEDVKGDALCVIKIPVSRDEMQGIREDFPNGKKLVVFTDSLESFQYIVSVKQTPPEACLNTKK